MESTPDKTTQSTPPSFGSNPTDFETWLKKLAIWFCGTNASAQRWAGLIVNQLTDEALAIGLSLELEKFKLLEK